LIKRHRNTSSDLSIETISTQSVCLSTERDGCETFPATVRHDGVEDAPRTTLDLTAGIVLIEAAIPRLGKEMSSCMPDLPHVHDASVTEIRHKNFGHSSKKPTASLTGLHMRHHAACNSYLGLPPRACVPKEVCE
jgi:hypothetical protein